MTSAAAAAPKAASPISGDGLPLSRFHIAALAFQRARQLQNGARPRVEAAGHKVPRVALLEVMADTISWNVDQPVRVPSAGSPT